MQERLQSWFSNVKERWNAIERKQRIKLVAAVALILVALGVALFLAFRPSMIEVARINMAQDRSVARSALQAEGIRHRFDGAALLVDERREDEALQLILQSEAGARIDTVTLSDVFEQVGMGTPAGMTRAALNEHNQSALARRVSNFDGISTATVMLSLPNEGSLWAMNNQEGTAAVQVTTYRNLTWREGETIARLVAGSFISLPLSNVIVTDQNMNVLFDGDSHAENARASTRADYVRQFEANLIQNMRGYFHLFDNVHFLPRLTFNWDEIFETQLLHMIPAGLEEFPISREDIVRETMQAMDRTDVVGMEANDLIWYGMPAGAWPMMSDFLDRSRTFMTDLVSREITRDTGVFLTDQSAITASAIVEFPHCERNLRERGIIGDHEGAEFENFAQYRASFENHYQRELATSTFGTPDAEGVFPGARRNEVYQRVAAEVSATLGIPFSLFVFEYHTFTEMEAEPPLNWWLIAVLALLFLFILLLAFGLIRRAQPDEVEEIEEPLTVEDMLATTQREEEIERQIEVEKLRAIELGGDSEAKKAIEKFVDERPEAVAGLLRNWLNEEWE